MERWERRRHKRESEIQNWGKWEGNSRIRKQLSDSRAKNRTLGEIWSCQTIRLAEFKTNRADQYREQPKNANAIQPQVQVGFFIWLRLDGFLGIFWCPNRAKQQPNFNIFLIHTQRYDPFL